MAFRYINPGYVYLLDKDCKAVETSDSTYSRTGSGFSQTNSRAEITVSNFSTDEDIWARFDVYLPSTYSVFNIYCLVNSYGLNIYFSKTLGKVLGVHSVSNYYSAEMANAPVQECGLEENKVNSVLFHMVFGDADKAYMEANINGVKFPRATGKEIPRGTLNTVILYANNENPIFSNIIISDKEISIKERAMALPIKSTETDMTLSEDGIYIADKPGQSLLSSADITQLVEICGENSFVTGIQLVGNPAYRVENGVTSLTALSKTSLSVTEHNSFHLSSDTDSIILDGWSVDDMKITDLANNRFGWKAGE